MRFDGKAMLIGVASGAALMLLAFITAPIIAFEQLPFCDANETGLTCARSWVNAIAVIAGAGTIFFLYRQVREQATQTAFVTGDATPTFDAYSNDLSSVYFRVTNWNRRAFVIESIVCEQEGRFVPHYVKVTKADGEETTVTESLAFGTGVRINAFIDRSSAPYECYIHSAIYGASVDVREFHFVLRGRLLGDEHRLVCLKARAEIETIAYRRARPVASDNEEHSTDALPD